MLSLAAVRAPAIAVPSLAQPSLSPDGREIAFVSGGSVWTVASSGGTARLLVDDGATDERPMFSPDGRKLAYISSKTGNGDIYVLTLATGVVARMTYDDGYDELDGWSPHGTWLYFANSSRNIYGAHDIYRVRSTGGTPMRVFTQPYINAFLAAPAPRGDALAFDARGFAGSQWWRKGHSHLDECEIWIRRGEDSATFERVTAGEAKDQWPMWSADATTLYFMSDRSGAQNLWEQRPGAQARRLTHFSDGRVVWPSIARNGSSIVFERGFGIWRYEPQSGRTLRVPITLQGALSAPQIAHVTLTDHFTTYAISPDGKKIVFLAHGHVFAAGAQDGGTAFNVPLNGRYALGALAWSPDSNSVAYIAGHGYEGVIETYDFLNDRRRQITANATDIRYLQYRPHEAGRPDEIAFEQSGRAVRTIDADGTHERTIASAVLPWTPYDPDRPLQWSPDGKWLAFFVAEPHGFSNVHVVDVDRPSERPVSFLANAFTNTIAWDPHGKFLLFDTTQRTEPAQVARVDLVPRTPTFEESKFKQLFTPSGQQRTEVPTTPAAVHQTNAAQRSKPEQHPRIAIQFPGIRERLQLLPVGLDVQSQSISPDGRLLLITASVAGQTNLYLFPLGESASDQSVAHQLTYSAGDKNFAAWAPDGKRIYYLDGNGVVHVVTGENAKDQPLRISAEFDDDWNRDKVEAFTQAWSAIADFYADPHTNGVDWDAVRRKYAPRIQSAQTPDEFRRLLSLMIGELNSSHSGVYPPRPPKRTTGRLGLNFDRLAYERSGILRITGVVPQSPADVSGRVHAGDDLVAVNGVRVGAGTNLDALLDNTIGKRVVLTLGPPYRQVAVQPVNYATSMTLRYREWVDDNRAYVLRASGGRLGYVHIPDMSAESLANLYKDLDVTDFDKAGVVIDIRSNEGGFVNAYALDVFARKPYLRMYPRNMPPVSARVELGQRALEKPTVLMVNEETLSDGEDFTQGYRQLHLGKVVGVPTAGWIIYTSAITLVDGTTFRLPFERVTTLQGQNMELHPRPVDVYVTRPVGSRTDPQLEAAVRTLLQELR